MKKLFGLFLIILLTISFAACTPSQDDSTQQKVEEQPVEQEPESTQEELVEDGEKVAEYSKIKQTEAKKLMEEQDPIVLDVREDYEYEEKHITGATLLPLGTVETRISEITEDKDALILVYCRSGNRSRTATEILVDLGYTNAHDFGGIIDWAYEVER